MAVFSRLLDDSAIPQHKAAIDIMSPLTGKSGYLDDCSDIVHQHRMMGEGMTVISTALQVLAPFDGIIDQHPDTLYRVRLRNKHGIRLQIQCEADAALLYGEGFRRRVKTGQKVKQGDSILDVDSLKLRQLIPNYFFTVTVLNSDKTKGILANPANVIAGKDSLFTVFI